jgi:hypothetical protein
MEGPHGEAGAAYGVVIKILHSLEMKAHYVVMDTYFYSIPFFQDLIQKRIYAIRIVRSNCFRLSSLKNTKAWK